MRAAELPRLPDWEDRLNALIEAAWHEPLRFGSHDCCLWGADAVLAQTGEDFGAAFRGTYSTAAGAARALRDFGAGTIIRTFDAALDRRPVALLRRGDLAQIGRGRTTSVGIVAGGVGLFVGESGLVRVERNLFARGWQVGSS